MAAWMSKKVIELRLILIGCSILLLVGSVAGIKYVSFSPDMENFFPENHPVTDAHMVMDETFTTTDNLLIAIGVNEGTVFKRDVLNVIENLTEKSWSTPHSVRVDSLTNFSYVSSVNDDLRVEPFIEDAITLDEKAILLKEELIEKEPLAYGSIISKDKKTTIVNILVDSPRVNIQKEYGETVEYVLPLLDEIKKEHPDLEIKLSGIVYVEYLSPRIISEQMPILVPCLFLVILTSLFFLVRSVPAVIGSLVVIIFSALSAVGLTGWTSGLVTQPFVMVPILVTTLAVADCVHLFSLYFRRLDEGISSKESMIYSLKLNIQPLFITTITTAIGFLSLNLAPVEPIRTVGNGIFFGVIVAFLFTIFFLAPLCSFFNIKAPKKTNSQKELARKIGEFSVNNSKKLFWSVSSISILLMLFIPFNTLNDSPMEFYSKKVTNLTEDTKWLSERLGGTFPVSYQLTSQKESISDPEFLIYLEQFTNWLEEKEEVIHVHSLSTIMKNLNSTLHSDNPEWYKIPAEEDLSAQYLFFYEMSLPFGLDLNTTLSQDRSSTKLIASLKEMGAADYKKFDKEVQTYLQENMPKEMVSAGSGLRSMFAFMGETMATQLTFALTIGALLILLTIVLSFRSIKLGLLTSIPNLLPIGVAFGVWGLIIEEVSFLVLLGMTTTLGIIVDFTVHVLSKYLLGRREMGLNTSEAIIFSFESVGFALIVLTVILSAGFLVLLFAYFIPLHGFALFSVLAFFIALIVDLLLFPALLLSFDKK